LLAKFGEGGVGMGWGIFRFVAAIIVAPIVGELAAIPAAFFIDIVVGAEVTGGRWPLNVPNVVLVCFKGLVVGCVAGLIAKKRGMLVAALANFLPLQVFIVGTLIINLDPTEYLKTIYDTHPSLWTWIGLVPAMVAGHFAARTAQQGVWILFQAVGAVFMFWVGPIAAAAIHLYTTYVAYQTSGVLAALLTFGMPPLSELYWLVSIWYATGAFFNLYTLRILALRFLWLIGWTLLVTGVMLENSANERNKLHGGTVQ